ncbi:MAG: hypothetical protein KDA60_01330 [Planctomycetales bacterium]|nr:hypothetical protein [Planctomycetales bacterium]
MLKNRWPWTVRAGVNQPSRVTNEPLRSEWEINALARRIRLWEKKRGSRRTGSRLLGGVSEGVFYAVWLLLGSAALIALLTSLATPLPGVPERSVGYGFWYAVGISACVAVGAAIGLVRTLLQVGTSAERRTAMAQKAVELDPLAKNRSLFREFPAIPQHDHLFESPGTTLAYRLPMRATFTWRLLGVALYAMLWNGLLSIVVAVAIQRLRARQWPWMTLVVAIPVTWVAVGAVRKFFAQILEITGLGHSNVEVSDLPFYPGQRYEISLVQAGRTQLRSIALQLICEEEATYRQGTDIRTERRRVIEQTCFRETDVTLRPREPFEKHIELVLPDDAMHTFQSGSNAIHWRLVVTGRLHRGTYFERAYPILVYPSPVAHVRH